MIEPMYGMLPTISTHSMTSDPVTRAEPAEKQELPTTHRDDQMPCRRRSLPLQQPCCCLSCSLHHMVIFPSHHVRAELADHARVPCFRFGGRPTRMIAGTLRRLGAPSVKREIPSANAQTPRSPLPRQLGRAEKRFQGTRSPAPRHHIEGREWLELASPAHDPQP